MKDVVVVGAGPYGLSIAAHLAATDPTIGVYGTPMQTWRRHMPRGMRLKSEGFASSLYDPRGEFPLSAYCREKGIPYQDVGQPVEVDIFAAYGEEFARRYVPMLEDRTVTGLHPVAGGFEVAFADGGTVAARRVVCAVGISHYMHVAPVLRDLPDRLLSHSFDHHDLSRFAGRRVAVVGGGASAADNAALLARAGARTHLITRRAALGFHAGPRKRRWSDQILAPMTAIGPSWKSVLCTRAPLLFHALPSDFRTEVTRRYLGPAPCWFVREQVEGNVAVQAGTQIETAYESAGRARLVLRNSNGPATLDVDHVLAATGYRVDLDRLAFLPSALRRAVRIEHGSPVLSRNFESSVPGLYFVGPSAANAFGPLLRFACGAAFAARRLSRHLN